MEKHKEIVVISFLLLILIIRCFLYFKNIPKYADGTIIRITSQVSSEAINYSSSQYLKLSGYKIYLPLYPRIYYGDRIVVEGRVEGEALKDAKLVKIMENKSFLYEFRKKLVLFYGRNLPKDHSALISGMVIGSKSQIGDTLWNSLVKSGTAHVVVASGMNVSMIAGFLLGILILFIPRRMAVIFAISGIWIYSLVSGLEAPIVRASVMGSTAFLAVGLGRMYSSLRILLITVLLMLIIKPLWLSDLGLWLSFLSTSAIILFYPKIKKFLNFVPKILNENLSTTLAAQIGVVPLLYYFFGQFNIFSPVINLLVLWTVVPITVTGMFAGIIGTLVEPIGRSILYLCYPLTSWFLLIVKSF